MKDKARPCYICGKPTKYEIEIRTYDYGREMGGINTYRVCPKHREQVLRKCNDFVDYMDETMARENYEFRET